MTAGCPARNAGAARTSLVRWLSGRKQRFAKAPYSKRVPRVRIPPAPPPIFPFLSVLMLLIRTVTKNEDVDQDYAEEEESNEALPHRTHSLFTLTLSIFHE